jgi:hypothetical protein
MRSEEEGVFMLHVRSPRPLPRAVAVGAALAVLALMAVIARPVQAAPPPGLTVDTLADGALDSGATTCTSAAASGKCTLRAALALNDAAGGGATVTLANIGTGQFQLSLGTLTIEQSATITGQGIGKSAVLGDGAHRVFDIVGPDATVAMAGLSVLKGVAADEDADGGGIRNVGHLTLTNVGVQANKAVVGGGIADFGTLRLGAGTVVTINEARRPAPGATQTLAFGGGIAEFGTLTATAGLLSSNMADDGGGNLLLSTAVTADGQALPSGTADMSGATFTQGTAVFGGGAFVDIGSTASFTASTFAGNVVQGTGSGGAIIDSCGRLTLTNDTLSGNRADAFGGAIHHTCESDLLPNAAAAATAQAAPTKVPHAVVRPPATARAATARAAAAPFKPGMLLDFVTIAGNEAATFGGDGIGDAGDAAVLQIHNSIIADKPSNGGKNCVVFETAITSLGYNVEDANDCQLTKTGDRTSTDPALGALKDNGGPTQTMALAAGTPAVDVADPACNQGTDQATDQRGVSRPQGSRCDAGAFELQVASTPTAPPTQLPQPPVTGVAPAGDDRPRRVAILIVVVVVIAVAGVLLYRRRRSSR